MLEPPVPPRPEPRRMFTPASLPERVREHWDDPRVRVGALLLAALIAGFAWYQLGVSGSAGAGAPVPTSAPSDTRTRADPARAKTPSPPGGFLMVHVAGAVAHPGVVRIRAGARVVDAVQAAGGGLAGADLDRLNLAAKVVDGQRVAVGLVGVPAPVETGTSGPTVSGDGTGTPGPVNLNTASATQLEELPGIGPSLAAAIIAERGKRGGFRAVGELQDVRGIGERRYADIKDLVSV